MNAPVGAPVGGRRRHLRLRRAEHVAEADLGADVDDRDDDDDVDQRVLDERDQRRRAQAGRVGVGGQHRERDDQRQVADEPVARAAQPHRVEHGLDADQLQRDVGHRGEDAGDRDGERESAAVVAAADEVGRRHVAVAVRDAPHARHEDEDDRVGDDRVRHGEEAAHRAGREHRRRHGHERVRGVEVAAEQEPRDHGAEAAPAQAPLVQAVQVRTAPPLRGEEAAAMTTTKKKRTTPSSTPLTPRARTAQRSVVVTAHPARARLMHQVGDR